MDNSETEFNTGYRTKTNKQNQKQKHNTENLKKMTNTDTSKTEGEPKCT